MSIAFFLSGEHNDKQTDSLARYGHRQDNRTGEEFSAEAWGAAEAHSSGIVFNVGREELQALLPEGYIIDPAAQPTVFHEILNLRKVPWLAGRGK